VPIGPISHKPKLQIQCIVIIIKLLSFFEWTCKVKKLKSVHQLTTNYTHESHYVSRSSSLRQSYEYQPFQPKGLLTDTCCAVEPISMVNWRRPRLSDGVGLTT